MLNGQVHDVLDR